MRENIIILENSKDKLNYQAEIQNLFHKIFRKPMPYYERFFTATPFGNKMICYTRDNAIKGMGNITRIQAKLDEQSYNYYLFTTSMIDESVRKNGAYFAILNTIKEVAMEDKVDFILAFPNANAYPILSKLGRFELIGKYAFSTLPLHQVLSLPWQQLHFTQEMLQWRLSFHQYYKHIDTDCQIIYKLYNDVIDVLHIFDNQVQIPIPTQNFNHKEVLMPLKFESKIHKNTQPICMTFFPILKDKTSLDFSPILSDVF